MGLVLINVVSFIGFIVVVALIAITLDDDDINNDGEPYRKRNRPD